MFAAHKIDESTEGFEDPGFDPKHLRGWFENLPLMNPAVCVNSVLQALCRCNAAKLPAKQRFALLVLYRLQIAAQFQAFGTIAFQRNLSEQTKPQVIADLSTLLMELARGFGILIRNGEQREKWPENSPYTHSVYAAMQSLAYSILHSVRTHAPLPPSTHLELNRLYAVAESRGVIAEDCGNQNTLCASNIGDLFKQVQLLSALDLFSIPEDELVSVFSLLGKFAAVCPIALERPPTHKEQVLVVDLAVNAVPFALQSKEELDSCTEPRFLSLGPVLRAAARTEQNRDRSAQHRAMAANAELIRTLLRKKTKQDRSASQKIPSRVIKATFGLDAIHYFLRDEGRRLRQALRDTGDTMQVRRRANGSVAKLETFLLEDKVEGGYRLRQPGLGHVELQVGELIGLSDGEPDGPYTFELAIVTWARHDRQDRIHFSVKRLCSGTVPAVCKQAGKVEARDGDTPNEIPCLYVPRNNSRTGRALLLAPSDTAWEQLPLWLETGAKTKLVNVGKRRPALSQLACYDIPGKGKG
ncbi:MAG: hypothetical protein AAF493_00390 [Pseudomonadota bacterium]